MNSAEKAELTRLREENAALTEAAKPKAITFKVGAKGGVSIYNLQRFPVTLYKDQWLRILDAAVALRAFIDANDAHLVSKPGK